MTQDVGQKFGIRDICGACLVCVNRTDENSAFVFETPFGTEHTGTGLNSYAQTCTHKAMSTRAAQALY